jgi:hypothetical protein
MWPYLLSYVWPESKVMSNLNMCQKCHGWLDFLVQTDRHGVLRICYTPISHYVRKNDEIISTGTSLCDSVHKDGVLYTGTVSYKCGDKTEVLIINSGKIKE